MGSWKRLFKTLMYFLGNKNNAAKALGVTIKTLL